MGVPGMQNLGGRARRPVAPILGGRGGTCLQFVLGGENFPPQEGEIFYTPITQLFEFSKH